MGARIVVGATVPALAAPSQRPARVTLAASGAGGPQRTRKLVSGPDLRLILHVRELPLSAPEPVIHWPGITTAELPVATPVHGHAGCPNARAPC
jgi:hypothetical protein